MRSLKRLNGLPLSKKFRYLSNAVSGEILRTRTVGAFGMRLVDISLTDRCQCRCGHCFAATQQPLPENEELTTARVKMLIDDLAEMGITEVCFSGGEPLLRRDILELVSYAHEKHLVARLITNGILLDERMVVDLKRAGLSWCSISIDSPKPAVHDSFRRYPGCFEKAVAGLKMLIKHKVACSIIAVARRELIWSGELEEIVNLGREIGVAVVRINFPVPIGRFINQQNQTLNLEERTEVRKLLRYGNVTMESPGWSTKCTTTVTKVNILPNGNVTPCVFVPLSYGNIRERRFAEIWKSMAEYNTQYKVNGKCPMCDPVLNDRIFRAAEERKAPETPVIAIQTQEQVYSSCKSAFGRPQVRQGVDTKKAAF